MDLSTLAVVAAFLGPISHVFWFIHGEQDFYGRQYLALWLAFQGAAFFAFTRLAGETAGRALIALNVVSASYLVTLFSSIILYRLFFHRTGRFPGPLSWRVTKLAQVVRNASDSLGYKHLDELHQKYGRYVRTGPNEISIVDPAAPPIVLGPGSKCRKAIWYDVGKPLVSMHQMRDKKTHDARRRVWDKGFNAKSLRDYETRVSQYADVLMKQLKAFGGGALNAPKWFNYYSFDVMGDLAFGESFHMLDTGEQHFAIPLLEQGMEPMNIIPAAPWIFWILSAFPVLSAGYHKFIKWSEEQVERRKGMKLNEPDIMSHLLEAQPISTDPFVNKNWEVGDARLIIVAGSDTTAATLAHCVYQLIQNPVTLQRLRSEVGPLVTDGHVAHQALQDCQYLNAIIDETLRLHPPVPSGLMRITPPEGLNIEDTFIPGDTCIILPLYSIQRSSEAYERPNEFIPERWTSERELVKAKGAWAPFSLGAFGCVGKGLAYMEMRTVLAKFITEFDFAFADREDGSNLINKTEDHFTLNLADMYITCKPRSG